MNEPRAQRSGIGGLLVVSLLAVVFFVLLGLVFTRAQKAPSGAPQMPRELFVIPAKLRVRSQPTAKAPVVGVADQGEALELLEDADAWARVRTRSGITGWAERNALERRETHERRIKRAEAIRKLPSLEGVAEKPAVLYSGPGIFYPIVGQLAPSSRLKVYTRDHDFFAVGFGKEVAYVEIEAVDLRAAGLPQLVVAAEAGDRVADAPRDLVTPPPVPDPSDDPEPAVGIDPPAPEPSEPVEAQQSQRIERGIYSAVPTGGTQPSPIRRSSPSYPAAARRNGAEGTVVIRAIIRRDGSIEDPQVLKDQPFGLGDAALDAVSRWRFRPATYQGEAIDVYYTVTVNFTLRE